jgi:AcrR family transcriptional regulator
MAARHETQLVNPAVDFLARLAGRRRSDLSRRQSEIFDQILDLYTSSGFSTFTLEQVASRLKCSKSTIYSIAPSREQLAVTITVYFFQRAARRIDEKVDRELDPTVRLETYVRGVAEELHAASAKFMDDIAAFEPTRRLYELNTSIAASRIRELIAAGVEADAFRSIQSAFVAEVVSAAMVSIQTRQMAASTGLSDAAAYNALADLIVHGIEV